MKTWALGEVIRYYLDLKYQRDADPLEMRLALSFSWKLCFFKRIYEEKSSKNFENFLIRKFHWFSRGIV